MLQASFTHHLIQLLLNRLEAEGHIFGVDTHLRLHELLKQLPDDYPPERLKTLLAPILTKSRESQQDFYDLFKETYKEVSALQNDGPIVDQDPPEDQDEKRWRWVVILLGIALLLGLLAVWKLTQQAGEEARQQFQQTVALYDFQPAYVRGDTLLPNVDSIVFIANGRSDSLDNPRVNYALGDSLRLILSPHDTVGVDSVSLLLSNPEGDTLRWTVKSILRTSPPKDSVKVAYVQQQVLFSPIDTLPFPHDVFSLATEPPTPTEIFLRQYLPWIKGGLLLLATALLLALLIWRERRRRKLVAEIEQGNQPPYVWDIKFSEPAEIDFGDDLGQLLNQLRQRTDAENSELDVPGTINATVKGGGMIEFRYRHRTRPPEYLLLIDEQSHRNHRARLFDELYERFKAEEILISRYFYHGDLRLCFNEEHPHGLSLPELSGKHPDTRLLIVGSGQGLLSPINGRLTKWSELLTRWSERAMLSPVPSSEWGRREEQLRQLLPVLPASLSSLSFLIDQFDAGEEGEIDKWQKAIRHKALPPLRLGEGGLLSSLKAHFSPELLQWLAACAVYPRLQFELTCQLGQLLSTPERNLLTSENINRLNQLPWLIEGKLPPAVRIILLEYLEEEEPTLLLGVREFLHTSLQASAPPAESAAANEHHLQLALNEWLFTQDQKRKTELEKEIAQHLRAGAEADFTVIKFLDRKRSPLDFIVPDRWKRYFSYSDYPALDWRELKHDLRWALPLWLALLAGVFWYSPTLPDECTGGTVIYQEQTLCLDSQQDSLWYYERLALDTIAAGDLATFDSLYRHIHRLENGYNGNFSITASGEMRGNFIAMPYEASPNLATALYNKGTALQLTQRDSACQYFSKAGNVDKTASTIWQEAAAWCLSPVNPEEEHIPVTQDVNGTTVDNEADENVVAYVNQPFIPLPDSIADLLSLPLSLYFENGTPDPGTFKSTTEANYYDLNVSYFAKKEEYVQAFTADMELEEAFLTKRRFDDFFEREVREGRNGLEEYAKVLEAQLENNSSFVIDLKGYTSPRGAFVSNERQSARRIESVINYFKAYNQGRLLPYINSGRLMFNKTAYGEIQADPRVSDRLDDPKNSVFSLFAMLENRVEVRTGWGWGGELVPAVSTTTDPIPAATDTSVVLPTVSIPVDTLPAAPVSIAPEMIEIKGGTLMMGCLYVRDGECNEDEEPLHEVRLSGFYMAKYEVTQAEWREVMGSDPPELYNTGCDQCPVEGVNWNDIQVFLQKLNEQTGLNYRLPTEAEWEYAARGGNEGQGFLYSGSNNIEEVAWYDGNATKGNTHGTQKTTRPVGGKAPNELGLYDMSGNVWEWCSDWYGEYVSSVQRNPQGPELGTPRVLRGGSWNFNPQGCRAASRFYGGPAYRGNGLGFRLARSF